MTEFQNIVSMLSLVHSIVERNKRSFSLSESLEIVGLLHVVVNSAHSLPTYDTTGSFQWDRDASEIGVIGREPYRATKEPQV